MINDTTETDFGIHRRVGGLGPTGDGGGRGFLLHSALLVQADTREVIGLAGQESFYRRTRRTRESEVWGRVIDLVGPPPDGVKSLHVDDRGADNIEVFCHLRQNRCGWVVRAAQLTRMVQTPDERRVKLRDRLAEQPVLGTDALTVRATKNASPRTARLRVRAAPVTLISPRRKTPYLRQIGPREISGWVVSGDIEWNVVLTVHVPGRGLSRNRKQISVEVPARYSAGVLFGRQWLGSRSTSVGTNCRLCRRRR